MNNFKVLSFLRKLMDTKIKSFIRSKKKKKKKKKRKEKNALYLILEELKNKYHEDEIKKVL